MRCMQLYLVAGGLLLVYMVNMGKLFERLLLEEGNLGASQISKQSSWVSEKEGVKAMD